MYYMVLLYYYNILQKITHIPHQKGNKKLKLIDSKMSDRKVSLLILRVGFLKLDDSSPSNQLFPSSAPPKLKKNMISYKKYRKNRVANVSFQSASDILGPNGRFQK